MQNFDKIKLDKYFKELYDNNKFMGNVSIFHDGIEIYSKSVGYADINTQKLNSKSSKSCVGSISKTFTAVMIFQAIDEGRLLLTETLDKYFPLIENAKKITIGHLLSHRSGIHNYTSNWEFMQWPAKTKEEMLEIIRVEGSDFEPGTNADYSNSGYVLLSYILESIYKKNYADILEEKIAMPLSLNDTYFGVNSINIEKNESNSYVYESDNWEIQTVTEPSVTLGAGCIISTSKDLNKFSDALFKGKLISKNSLSAMLHVQDNYGGMGIFPVPYFSKQGYGHRGGVDGYNSMLIYMPDEKISYAITSNGLNYNFTEIHIAVLHSIYGSPFEVPSFTYVSLHPELLNKYTGTYISSQIPLKITVTISNNQLLIQEDEQPEYQLESSSKYIFKQQENDIIIEFDPKKQTMVYIKGEEVFYFDKK